MRYDEENDRILAGSRETLKILPYDATQLKYARILAFEDDSDAVLIDTQDIPDAAAALCDAHARMANELGISERFEVVERKSPDQKPDAKHDMDDDEIRNITSILIDGLTNEGVYHKQFALEEVLRLLAPDEFDECKESWRWEDGIAP